MVLKFKIMKKVFFCLSFLIASSFSFANNFQHLINNNIDEIAKTIDFENVKQEFLM